ncbi:hypothetical protein M436DRAFT_72925 [Aureobasidium namibiae CBS 147.97]|uniref:Choline transport protein n=1 Tax=Aureobasidium namibiae CBS 147.97 TaxID=1043004 RepID=A0A074WI53_9PEZI|nr:uncharacterized protein M436DRAFT_72925 [Aureobasidium namibiae CBS 147.97]KEQ72728.1 hypothetical protein M436DRAFT_72925 [Aureobasidium namibiae CBS 147.97]
MADGKIAKGTTTLQSNASSSEPSGSVGTEDVIGHSQDLKRNYSLWSILGAGFSLTNSWFGVSIAMVTGINSGGPVLLVYGIIIVMLVSICVGISLSELASALPNTAIFSCASTTIGVASGLVGCWQLSHPDYIIKDYHVFVTYLILTWVCFLFNCYGKILPSVATTGLYCSLISFIVILATVPVTAPSHQTPKFVFATFINNTGWSNAGIAFVTGLINANWAFACLDCATHLAEEALIMCTGLGCVIAGHTWQSRLCFSFARDSGVPGHKWLQKIDHKLDVPLNAHFTSCLIVTIVGCMYLASTAAFNAMSSACIVLLYISYAIPIICLLSRGREQSLTGPFNMGVSGLVSNYVLLAWTIFTLILYSFPSYMPATAGNMNYVCVVYAIVLFIIAVDWILRGKKHYRGQEERQVGVEDSDILVKPGPSAA